MDEKDGEQKPRRRLQFGLLSLFVVTLLVALALGVVQSSTRDLAPLMMLEAGLLCTLVMAAIGVAVGREWGALLGTVLGAGFWCLLIAMAYFVPNRWFHQLLPTKSLPMQCLALLLTVAAIVVPCVIILRRRKPPDDAPHTTGHLLEDQKQRKREM